MVEAGKKAVLTRLTGSYTFEEHHDCGDDTIKNILMDLRDFILSIDEAIEESPKKFYIAYKISQSFVCVEVKRNKLILFLKINPEDINIPGNGRDVTDIGHYGTGNFESTISNRQHFEEAKEYIKQAFETIGG